MNWINNFLKPNFLIQYDNYLLKNKPTAWSLRLHTFGYYAFLFSLLCTLLCFLFPFNVFENHPAALFTGIVTILSALGLITWIYFLLRFNVFKVFGKNYTRFSALKSFITFVIIFFLSFAIIQIPTLVVQYKANKKYPTNIIVNDLNEVNRISYLILKDSLFSPWQETRALVLNDKNAKIFYSKNEYDDSINFNGYVEIDNNEEGIEEYEKYKNYNCVIYSSLIDSILMEQDSFVKLKNDSYIFYDCPTYSCVSCDEGKNADISSLFIANIKIVKCKSSLELFKQYRYQKPNKEDYQILKKLQSKYLLPSDYIQPNTNFDHYEYYNQKAFARFFVFDNQFDSNVRDLISNKESINITNWMTWLFLPLLFSFIFSYFLFVFRHSSIKSFFLSILISILLFSFWVMIFAFFKFKDDTIFLTFLVNFILFGVIIFLNFKKGYKTSFNGAFLNIFLALFASFFIYLPSYFFFYDIYGNSRNHDEYYSYEYIYTGGIIANMFLMLLWIPFVLYPLYKKWYALPEKN